MSRRTAHQKLRQYSRRHARTGIDGYRNLINDMGWRGRFKVAWRVVLGRL